MVVELGEGWWHVADSCCWGEYLIVMVDQSVVDNSGNCQLIYIKFCPPPLLLKIHIILSLALLPVRTVSEITTFS